MGIKTELDLRKESEIGGITSSILGEDIKYVNIEATNYHSIFTGTHIDNFKKELELFADIKNYPIYFHCWGGADRTGTLAFFIEGLCGVNETDLAIDFELTSFSHFGLRHRYDGSGFYYASLLNKIKEYSGDTLQDKFENAAMNTFGLSRIQIANIQSVFSGSSVVFASTTDGSDEGISGTSFPFKLANLGNHTVTSVKFNNTDVEYKLENNVLTVAMPDEEGMGTITFDDDNTLNIYSVGGNTSFTSNVKDKTGITNVGADATELISVDFESAVNPLTKDNLELYVGDKSVDDFDIIPTENGFKLDPMYFSTLNAEKNAKNIYPQTESECRIVINGVTSADGTSLGKYSVNFTSGLILPVPYKENSKIMNVSQGIAPILADGVIENKYNRGNKEVVTDGKLYGNWEDLITATFEKTQYNQAILKLDLGTEYDIAGIALSGSAKNSGYNCFYAVECNNDPNTEIMTESNQILRLTWINDKTDFIGYDIDTTEMTDNEILSNFSVGENKSRYVHVGTAIPRTGLDVSELMVWAYVEKVTLTPSLTSVGNNGIITNVGTNASEYVKLSLNNDSVSFGESLNVAITTANGSETTATATKLANENAYRIEVKDLAGLSSTQNTVQNFVSSGTVNVKISDIISSNGKYVTCNIASAEVGQIVPLEYKNGKKIVDVASGKGVYMPNGDSNWTGLLTDSSADTSVRAKNTVLSTNTDESGKTVTTYDHSKPALKLDLGAQYDIAGMTVTGIGDSGHYSTRYQRFITSNDSSLNKIDDVSEYLKTPGTSMVSKTQALTSFPENTVNARYIYIGNTNNYEQIGISDIHVYAYVDADAANLYTANSANGGIRAGSYYKGDNKIIIGKYTSDGALVKATASDSNGIAEVDNESEYGYRIFMWDSLSGMKPLTDDIKYN